MKQGGSFVGQIGLNHLDANLITTLSRYIDEYKWGWGIARRQLRMRFNVDIPVPELQQLYKQSKIKRPRV